MELKTKQMKINQKERIKISIQRFIDQFTNGDQLRSDDIVKAVKRDMNMKYIYPDTILRYLREMRTENKLNYICTNKADRIFKIIKQD